MKLCGCNEWHYPCTKKSSNADFRRRNVAKRTQVLFVDDLNGDEFLTAKGRR